MTSREWRSILRRSDFVVLKDLDPKEVPAVLKHFRQCYGKPIGLEFKYPTISTHENLGAISGLTNLTSLKLPVATGILSTPDITPLLTSLTNLQVLECTKTSEALLKLPHLTKLTTKWYHWANYPKLVELHVEGHGYPEHINPALPSLQNTMVTSLTLDRVDEKILLAMAASFINVRYLRASPCDRWDEWAHLREVDLQKSNRLEHLELSCGISNAPDTLTQLTTLKFHNGAAPGTAFEQKLRQATNLRNLKTWSRGIDYSHFPNLESLEVNDVTDSAIQQLNAEKLTKLVAFTYTERNLHIGRLTSLMDLTLTNCPVEFSVFSSFSKLTKLTISHMSRVDTRVNIKHVINLQQLTLQRTKRAHFLLSGLERLTSLEIIDFDDLPNIEVPTTLRRLVIVSDTAESKSVQLINVRGVETVTHLHVDAQLVTNWVNITKLQNLRKLVLVNCENTTVEHRVSKLPNLELEYQTRSPPPDDT